MDEPKTEVPTDISNSSEEPSDGNPDINAKSTVSGVKVIQPLNPNLTPSLANTAVNPIVQPSTHSEEPVAPQVPTISSVSAAVPVSAALVGAPVITQSFATGSQIHLPAKKLPLGVYIFAGLNIIGFGLSFVDTSQTAIIYSIAMMLDLFLAIGLLLRLEGARKLYVWGSVIIICLSLVSIFLLSMIQHNASDKKAKFDEAAAKIDPRYLSIAEHKQLDDLTTEINSLDKKLGKVVTFAYVKYAVTIAESAIVIFYFTRPSVKEVFNKDTV